MVLRKPPPPRLENLSKGNHRSEFHSPTSSLNSASSPRRAHLNRLSSQESIYSPDLNTSPAFDLMPLEEAQQSPVGSPSSHPPRSWSEGPGEPTDHDRPATGQLERLPPVLVPGQQASSGTTTGEAPVQLQSNNPFLKPKPLPSRPDSPDPSEWNNDRHSHATTNSDPLSQTEGYIPMTARLSLLDHAEHDSPWPDHEYAQTGTIDSKIKHEAGDPSPWGSQHSIKISAPQEVYLQGGQSNPYAPAVVVQPSDQSNEPSYNLLASHNQGRLSSDPGYNSPSALSSGTSATSHELIDLDDSNALGVETGSHRAASSVYSSEGAGATDGNAPSAGLAPVAAQASHASQEQASPSHSTVLSPADAARQKEQRAETYSIRHINRVDRDGALFQSPILVQNENGPCPLLALVNALVLRAAPKTPSPIVKALGVREQISLGLLIEALFEELTTCLGPDEEFPDIEALTQFLTMLHTGMNVNPCLTLETSDSLGTFLQTNDLRLYRTFGIPLIHGWIASWSSQAHTAMTRTARYHEDIQLLPFRKQELEDRVMRGESLSPSEEQVVADIQAIQDFVDLENATQLSPFGLTQLTTRLAPGSVSILFRNDHFSTLYKHPQSHQLYTLVTDAGYANHAEVVWESLVDVTGFNSEFLSGDFRVVGNSPSDSAGGRTSSAVAANSDTLENKSESQEQSDADYAYALSLQFEEEQRRERTRNQQSTSTRTSPPSHTPAGTSPHMRNPPSRSSSIATGLRTSQAQHGPDPDDPNAPPPPYEQAAGGPRYSPPDRRPQRSSFQSEQYPGNRYARPIPSSNHHPSPNRHGGGRRNSRECIVM
ncbi:Protein of unknown function DUF544 [Penicillium capsulatum]|uniref:MINDY deubiquitinase domain-containing protein n=1 Tax=Penicillium capsulatum TaxID=69766 RepID=A0A9W9IR29_9EURO|nr:Protein of unknown function DUF544 [Penicillium capsulatum]KAJ6130900.1 Protein of unknown function DUF544 [Penicillium capsulatum]